MELRMIPKVLLWIMLILSTLEAISSLVKPETDHASSGYQTIIKQQMAVHTAVNFAREWLEWNGEELPEERLNRLKPYVNPTALSRVASIRTDQKNRLQKVVAAEFVSFTMKDVQVYTVRVRVVVLAPERMTWVVEVPVWVHPKIDNGVSVTEPPVIRLPQNPPIVPEHGTSAVVASSDVKQRMKPTIESFLKALCEGNHAENLSNYIGTGTTLLPLQGRIRMITLDSLEVKGLGPYTVKVSFTVQDSVTGFSFSQVWLLNVAEENQKFFVNSLE